MQGLVVYITRVKNETYMSKTNIFNGNHKKNLYLKGIPYDKIIDFPMCHQGLRRFARSF